MPQRPQQADQSGLYLALIVFALAVTLWLMLQLLGFLLKVFVFAAVVVVAVAAWRAWRAP
jgi:hypothetical protein